MKYIWEESDIVPGRIVCKNFQEGIDPSDPFEPFKPDGWKAKWTRKIGWYGGAPSSHHFCFIAMTDGMVTRSMTKAEMVERLNKDQMIPMPHPWMMAIMDWMRSAYKKGD